MPCAGNAPSLVLLFSFSSLLFCTLLFSVAPVSSRSCHFVRLVSTPKKATTIRARRFSTEQAEQAVERIEKDNARSKGRERERESENGSRSWYALDWCKLQVYRGKTRRRRRWSVVRAGRAAPTPILIKRSHKRLTNWLYVRWFIGVPEQDVKMFQS